MIDRTFEAMVFDWEIAGASLRPASVVALRRRVEALSAACVDVAVLSESPVGVVNDQLGAQPRGPGHLLVCGSNGSELSEIGPDGLWIVRPQGGEQFTGSEALRGLFASFVERGVGPGLVLVVGGFGQSAGVAGSAALLQQVPEAGRAVAVTVGVEPSGVSAGVLHLGGGAATLMRLLDEQLRRRRRRRVPSIDEDPAWIIRETGADPLPPRDRDSVYARSRWHRHSRIGGGGDARLGAVGGRQWHLRRDRLRPASAPCIGVDRAGHRACACGGRSHPGCAHWRPCP